MLGCLSIKQFPAWAIARARDYPPDCPLLVQEGDHILSLNPAASRLGLEVGMTAARAAALCPSALIPVRDREAEHHAWDFVMGTLLRVTPFLERDGPVVYLSAGRDETMPVVRELGASAGFSTNRTIARLASVRAGSGELIHVPAERTADFLSDFPTRLLTETGFSEELVEQFELLGCNTLGLVQRLTERHMVLAFGDQGKSLFRFLGLRSSRAPALYREPASIKRRFWIETPCEEPHDLLPVIADLAVSAADALPSLLSGQIRLNVSLERRGEQTAARILPSPTADPHRILRFTQRLALDLFTRVGPLEGDRIDGVEVILTSLVPADSRQASFFGEKKRWVDRAVDEVHRRYPRAIKSAIVRSSAHFHEDGFAWKDWSGL